jgi:error-prone DNA polymerase
LRPNAEWRLKSAVEMGDLFRELPQTLTAALAITEQCTLDLTRLRPSLPAFDLPTGETPFSYLFRLCHEGAHVRYHPITPKVMRQLTHELEVIEKLGLAGYFLIVWDVARFCAERSIMAQGRGSAANSAVCYALGITNVDPISQDLLFERFLSEEREGFPDIDLDIAHQDREQVIQYVYNKYGREHAAMVCEVITYRARSAVRDIGKALGLSLPQVDTIAKSLDAHAVFTATPEQRAAALAQHGPVARQLYELCAAIDGFPRHLSIHVGGFVITGEPLVELAPIEPATMADRTVVQWDKDDVETLGFVKFDLLGLGMLTLIDRAIKLVNQRQGPDGSPALDLARLDYRDAAVYDMLGAADTVGVFQVESRAQMATLPRVRPRTLYELAIQVALIRPGPIQGQMVHPYIRRRNGEEEVSYPHPLLEPVLERTLGVPLFQEQGMRLAIAAANFSPAKADALRKAMGSKRSHQRMQQLYADLITGMAANGIAPDLAERICKQLAAFADYGFPESHACAFAALVYISAYLKRHHPVEFTCALLNAQPMGFYQPAVIVNDARRHGVPVLPADVTRSRANCTLEGPMGRPSVRLGLRYVRSVGEEAWPALDAAAEQGPYASVEDFARRTGLGKEALEHLAAAGAFAGLGLARRDALWQVEDYGKMTVSGMLPGVLDSDEAVAFPSLAPPETTAADYWHAGLSTSHQPISFFRRELNRLGTVAASKLAKQPQGRSVKVAGLVVIRQRPQTAKGFVFCTLEDETGLINVVISPWVYERYRAIIRTAPMLVVEGIIERERDVVNVWTRRAWPLSQERLTQGLRSRDFR